MRRTKALCLGPALDYSADVGSLISQDQLDKITAHIQDAVAKGATVLAGGQARPELGPYFFEPTILTDVTPEMKLYREETFGPVVAIYRFDDVEDADPAGERLRVRAERQRLDARPAPRPRASRSASAAAR